jgi:predicted transcriptional regulator
MALNMACLDISVEELVGCSFGLSKAQARALMSLLEEKDWAAVSALSSKMGKERSVIQRDLARLLAKGLIERDQANKAGGGYEYLYRAKDKMMLKKAILEKSRAFSVMVREAVRGW